MIAVHQQKQDHSKGNDHQGRGLHARQIDA